MTDLSYSSSRKNSILFVGAAGLDTLMFLDSYPVEDAKVRAVQQRIEGGGNAANCAVGASRLGVSSYLFSAVGSDINAEVILEGLRNQDVNVEHVQRREGISGTTFVIVCTSTSTRTCIHNPITNDITASDISKVARFVDQSQIKFVHFDSRHTEAAVALAQHIASQPAQNRALISIDMEKIRPFVLDLLPYCDFIFTNQTFPVHLSPEESDLTQRLLNILAQPWARQCKVLITTLGASGSVLMYKYDVHDELGDWVSHGRSSGDRGDSGDSNRENAADIAWSGLQSSVAACTAISTYTDRITGKDGVVYSVIRTSAYPVSKEHVVDTTGAGDAFIGAFLSAFAHGWTVQNCARLGTVTAALKIQQPGARQGLPTFKQVYGVLN